MTNIRELQGRRVRSAGMERFLDETRAVREEFRNPLGDSGYRRAFYDALEPHCTGVDYRTFTYEGGGRNIQIVPTNALRNHYPLTFLRRLKTMELDGTQVGKGVVKIQPGRTQLSEVTSGSACISFGPIAHILGFRTRLYVPLEIEFWDAARIHLIKEANTTFVDDAEQPMGKVILSREHSRPYLQGAIDLMQEEIPGLGGSQARRSGELSFPNHSRVPETIEACRAFMADACRLLKRDNITPDAIVLGLGNGTSALGYIEEIRAQFGEAVAFFGFEGKYAPGVYQRLHGHPLTEGDEGRLSLYGCDGSEGLDFPCIDELIRRGIQTKENHFLVSREEVREWFERENTGRNWRDIEGRSSLAARIVTQRELLRKGFRNIVCIRYDGACYGSNVPVTQESVYRGDGFYQPQDAHMAWLLSNDRIAEICSPKR